MNKRRFGLYINLLGVIAIAVFIATVIQFFSNKVEVDKVYVVNKTGNSASIIWFSEDEGEYELVYSDSDSSNPIFLRDYEKAKDNYKTIGQNGKSKLHYHTLENLKPDTNYYVWIKDKYARLTKLDGYEIKVASIPSNLKTPNPIYGRVLNSQRSIVFVTTGDAKHSITTIPNKEGNWSIDASLLNLDKIDETTKFEIKVLNESNKGGKLSINFADAKPTPTIVVSDRQRNITTLAKSLVNETKAQTPPSGPTCTTVDEVIYFPATPDIGCAICEEDSGGAKKWKLTYIDPTSSKGLTGNYVAECTAEFASGSSGSSSDTCDADHVGSIRYVVGGANVVSCEVCKDTGTWQEFSSLGPVTDSSVNKQEACEQAYITSPAASSDGKCEGWAEPNTIHWNKDDGYCYLCNSEPRWQKLDKEIEVYSTKYNKPPEYTAPSQAEWCRAVYGTDANVKARSEWEASIGGGSCQNSWSPDGSVHWNIVTNKCYCCDPFAKTWESPYPDSPPPTGSTVDRTLWCRDSGRLADGKTYGQDCSPTGQTIYPDAEEPEDAPEVVVGTACPRISALGLNRTVYSTTGSMDAAGVDGTQYTCADTGNWAIKGGDLSQQVTCYASTPYELFIIQGTISCPSGTQPVIPATPGGSTPIPVSGTTIPSGSKQFVKDTFAAEEVSEKGEYEVTYGDYTGTFLNLSNTNASIQPFVDYNKNNKKDSNEEYIENFEVKRKEGEIVSYDLEIGWNLINLPFETEQDTLKEFVDYLESKGANITHAWVKGEVITFREYNEYGNDVDLKPGDPLFILNQSNASILVKGQNVVEDMANVEVAELEIGWHLVSFSKATKGKDAFELMDELRAKNEKIVQMATYKNGQYWVIIIDEQGVKYGNTFVIYSEDGVFIEVAEQDD